jgi:hypothetical protein
MVPDALLLSLHQHGHTEHVDNLDHHQAKLEKEHKHCPVEDLFEASFQGSQHPGLYTPVVHKTSYNVYSPDSWYTDVFFLTHQRGPPAV